MTATCIAPAATDFEQRLTLYEEIGAGGLCVVHRAFDSGLDMFVAVKRLRPQFRDDPKQLARLKAEYEILGMFNHPNIVRPLWDDLEQALIVLELVEGISLRNIGGTLQPEQAAGIGLQICSGLVPAHARNIVHRDIKPDNVLLKPDGQVKIIDFSVAKSTGDSPVTPNLDMVGVVNGSHEYCSPEQALGGPDAPITPASDIYSLGLVLFRLLTGQSPFDIEITADGASNSGFCMAVRIANREPRRLAAVCPDAWSLDPLITWMLDKDPAERPSIHKVSDVLARVA